MSQVRILSGEFHGRKVSGTFDVVKPYQEGARGGGQEARGARGAGQRQDPRQGQGRAPASANRG